MAVAAALAGSLLCAGEAAAQNADVMHWWTSGGEFARGRRVREGVQQARRHLGG